MENLKQLLSMWVPVEHFFSFTPTAASTQAGDVDAIYAFLIWTCLFLFLAVMGPATYFCFRYRRKTEGQRALSQKDHNQILEVTWTVLPMIYLSILFYWGFQGFLSLYTPPLEAKRLHVTGQKWLWTVDYPEEQISVSGQGAVIALPIGKPVELRLASQDVIHSFFVPNFRVKQDVVPGRYTTLWFEPTTIGEYPVFCAEYCGDEHSNMMAKIKVMPQNEYDSWVEQIKGASSGLSPKELGEKLYVSKGCNACHTMDGTIKIGPSFKGVYGKKQDMEKGGSVVIDDKYIQSHLMDPQAHTAKGFPAVMPSFKGQLSEREIAGLIEFIKSTK